MRAINLLLGVIAALLASAALGAIWSLAGLAGTGRAAWMAPVTAFCLAWLLRFNNHPPGVSRALVCAGLWLLTAAYTNYLIAAGFIAGQMGLGFAVAVQVIGIDMAYAVTRAHTDGTDWLWYGAALLLALILGFRQPGENKQAPAARGKR